jgi:hypothetical protein
MNTSYLKIIFCFLLITAILQALFAQTHTQKPMFINDMSSNNLPGISTIYSSYDSLYLIDTAHGTIHYRDFINSEDSTYVENRLKKLKLSI